MRAAYEQAGWEPADVDLIECHATGTPVGDAVEFASLRALWGESAASDGGCVIGSVKSNVGHALTAAGAAGLLKVLLALKQGVLPPTAGFDRPAPGLDIERSPFRILAGAEPWQRRAEGRPRRVALSGFGFGGINAHVLIEEWVPASPGPGEPGLATLPRRVGRRSRRADRHRRPRRPLRPVRRAPGVPAAGPRRLDRGRALRAQELVGRRAIRTGSAAKGSPIAPTWPTGSTRSPCRPTGSASPRRSWRRCSRSSRSCSAWRARRSPTRAGTTADPPAVRVPRRARARHERDQLPRPLVAARQGPRVERTARPGPLGRGPGRLGLASFATPSARPVGEPDDGGAWGASSPAGSPASSAWAGRASPSRARRPRASGRSTSPAGCSVEGELDEAIVGAVDLPRRPAGLARERPTCTPRRPSPTARRSLVLKRLADAERDGDKVYAVIRGVGLATGDEADRTSARRAFEAAGVSPSSVGYVDSGPGLRRWRTPSRPAPWPRARGTSATPGRPRAWRRWSRRRSALHQQILPPLRGRRRPELDRPPRPAILAPRPGRRAEAGARRRLGDRRQRRPMSCSNRTSRPPSSNRPIELRPLGPRPSALFASRRTTSPGWLRGLDELEALARSAGRPDRDPRPRVVAVASRRPEPTARGLDRRRRPRPTCSKGSRRPDVGWRARIGRGAGGSTGWRSRPSRSGRARAWRSSSRGWGTTSPGWAGSSRRHWPEVLRGQDSQERAAPEPDGGAGRTGTSTRPRSSTTTAPSIFGQVSFGTFVSDLLRSLGVRPDAAIGYSLGETTALFALGAWTDRDEMFRRFDASTLFRTDLAGPCDAARPAWSLADDEPVDWVAGILQRPAEIGPRGARRDRPGLPPDRQHRPPGRRRRPGGGRPAAGRGGRRPVPPAPAGQHRPLRGRPRGRAGRTTTSTCCRPRRPPGVRFYSGSSGRVVPGRLASRPPTRSSAHALHGVDFPSVVRRAYDDGVRAFVEVGPGGSCTRMIGEILEGRPHLAVAACPASASRSPRSSPSSAGWSPSGSRSTWRLSIGRTRRPIEMASAGRSGSRSGGRPFAVDAGSVPVPAVRSASPSPPGEGPG